MNLLVFLLLVILIFGGIPTAPWYASGPPPWGWYGPSGLTLVLFVLLLVALARGA